MLNEEVIVRLIRERLHQKQKTSDTAKAEREEKQRQLGTVKF